MSKTCNDCYHLGSRVGKAKGRPHTIAMCLLILRQVNPSMTACVLFTDREGSDGQEYREVASTVVPVVAGV